MISETEYPTIASIAPLLAARRVSSVELTRSCLERIARGDSALHAFQALACDSALAAAARADRELAAGTLRGPLHGVPVAVKDVYDVRGIATTGGSVAYATNVASSSATAVQRLEDAGAVLLGKLATHELTYGGVDMSLPWPPARNPWDPTRDPGGSSSGSGVAVAAGFCLGALGTDTGGSVRLPAGLCGVVGLKPTYGRVSRRGVMLNSWTLDHCGPMAWTVADCAFVLQAIAGYDPLDPASALQPVPDYSTALGRGIRGLRLGVVRHFYERDLPLSTEARGAMGVALSVLRELGAELQEVALPSLAEYAEAKVTIQRPEIYSVYGDEVRRRPRDFGPRFRERIAHGEHVSAVDYVRAQEARREFVAGMHVAMDGLDALVTCGAPGPAPLLADVAVQPSNRPEITVAFSMTGFPTISICIGFSEEGLPLAMQVAGRPFDELTVLRVADAYERATPWRGRRPPSLGLGAGAAT